MSLNRDLVNFSNPSTQYQDTLFMNMIINSYTQILPDIVTPFELANNLSIRKFYVREKFEESFEQTYIPIMYSGISTTIIEERTTSKTLSITRSILNTKTQAIDQSRQ